MRRSPPASIIALVLVAITGCTATSDVDVAEPSAAPASVADTTEPDSMFESAPEAEPNSTLPEPATTDTPTTESNTTSSTTTTTPSSTTTSTTTTSTTLPAGSVAPQIDLTAESIVLGTSVQGRPIVAERYGTPGGRRVLVIGVIHGNEDAGVAVIDDLRAHSIAGSGPDAVELWLIESMNPDGQAAQDRHNANEVDLNRNFPLRWGPIGVPGDGQYAGTGPASEPETQSMVAFISQLRPDLTIWYHQDANLIIPSSGRDGRVRARYAELSGLAVADCCDGGVYTGTAATWARGELADQDGVAFIVELPGGELTAEQVTIHADTVAVIATDLATL